MRVFNLSLSITILITYLIGMIYAMKDVIKYETKIDIAAKVVVGLSIILPISMVVEALIYGIH